MQKINGGKTELEILTESSQRLEGLTKVLIVLTAILAVLTGITIFK
jgi:hypothetical protein